MTIKHPDRTVAPALKSFGPLTLPPAASRQLENGVTILSVADPESEVCRISIAIPGGIGEETPDGALGIIAQALSEGSDHHTGADISQLLENYGAWSGATLSTHHTVFTLSCLSRYLGDLLELIKEIVTRPAFEENAMKGLTERLASRNEVNRCKVEWLANDAIRPVIYGPGSPLAVSCTPDQIRAVTPQRLREVHFDRLDPRHTIVFVSGGLSGNLLDRVAETFSNFEVACHYPIHPIGFPFLEGSERVFTEMPDALQSALVLAIPVIGRNHPDFVPLRTVVTALGGYFGSRLMVNIREEKGLTYGIGAALLGYEKKGFVTISTQTATEYVGQVEQEIFREIERLKDPASYTADEMGRLGFYIRSGLASALDTAISRMELLQSYRLAGAPAGYFEEQDEFARHLTAERLAEVAAKYLLTSSAVISIAGSNRN